MDEILYELPDHSAGLNAGRWDDSFSRIKKVPRASRLRVARPREGAHDGAVHAGLHGAARPDLSPPWRLSMGGMAAFIPNRRDPNTNQTALPRVRDDKIRESRGGFDGTWVAHPDLVPVSRKIFAEFMANISIGIQYIESWLSGTSVAAIFNLVEVAATAEISRSQVWQWIHHGATLSDGQRIRGQHRMPHSRRVASSQSECA